MATQNIGREIIANFLDAVGVNNVFIENSLAIDANRARSIGIENAELGTNPNGFTVDLNGGSDTVIGIANARAGTRAVAEGIRNQGQIALGALNDLIEGEATAVTRNGLLTIASGINNTSGGLIRAGSGADRLIGNAFATGQNDVGAFGILTSDGSLAPGLTTGLGEDLVFGQARASGITTTDARGVSIGFSDIDDDTIAGNPPGFSPTISGVAEVGRLLTQQNNDTIQGIANVSVNALNGDQIFFAGANGIVVDGGTISQLEQLLATIGKNLRNFTAADIEQILPQLETSTLDTGGGNDSLIADVTLNVTQEGIGADGDLEVIGDGIENAGTILLGAGDDRVVSQVSVTSTINNAKGLADALDNSSVGIITGLNLEVNNQTLFDLGEGNDSFTSNIRATAVNDLAAADGLGNRGIFDAGAGSDTFNLTANSRFVLANEDDTQQQEAIADGWENRNQVFLDGQLGQFNGNDSVTTNATAAGEGILTIAEGIETRELFNAGGGNDSFDLTATAITGKGALFDNLTQAAGLQTEQIDEGEFILGQGNNSVIGNATANSQAEAGFEGIVQFIPSTFAFGITQMTADANNNQIAGDATNLLSGENGNDLLDGTARATGLTDVAAFGILLENARTNGGLDTLVGSANAQSSDVALATGIAVGLAENVFLKTNSLGNSYGLGAEAGTLDTGAGNDILEATAVAVGSSSAIARGIDGANGSINLGAGADTINANATALSTNSSNAVGIFGGNFNTGAGADTVIARSNDNLIGTNGVSLIGGQGFGGNVNINLGIGNDTLQGFGAASINGGLGTDTLVFEFSQTDFINGGGVFDPTTTNFTFAGVTLQTTNFEFVQFSDITITL